MASTSTTHQIVPYASFSSSSNSTSIWKYDVFLSFRGDTRKNFTDHLYAALVRAGINTFRDDNEMQRGEEIGPELRKAIKESRFSIIVLSKNFASSTWCLDELEHILACRRTLGHAVWPIFYDIQPSKVRYQKKSFAKAFRRHEERFKDDMGKVTRWRVALAEVANLKGLDVQNHSDGHESKIIDNIVNEILDRLPRTKLSVPNHPVGLRYRAEEVISMLFDESLDVCVVGIYGIGGIGKTTIAKEIYNSISHNFQASCFLANIRENSDRKGLIKFQRQLLFETLMGKHEKIYDVDGGLEVIKKRLRHKRVLIVLDDVDNELHQLNKLLGDCTWLFPGSRVLITTRIEDLLKTPRLYKQYKVQELDHSESFKLLSLHAFHMDHPIKDYMNCAHRVVRYAGGIPLILEVLGSSLFGEHIDVWNSTLRKLKVISKEEIHTRLKISYDSLDDVEKSLFLDVACFFVGFDKDHVISILEDCGFFPIAGFNKIMKRCLISISFNKLMMHDSLRDMGREIVRQECPEEPGNRSRLWRHEDAIDVLTNKTGTKAIEGLILDLPGQCEILSTKAFKKMNRLRLLQLNYVCLTGSFERFSRKIRWLCWHGFPLGSIPADLHLGNLVSLDMQYSKLNQFQEENLRNLKLLDLSHSHVLTKISNFEGFPNLEILSLEDCKSLVELHESIGVLMLLHSLNLQYCKSLRSLPRSIGKLRSLEILNISGCSKLKELPETIGDLKNLESFSLRGCLLPTSPRNSPCIISKFSASLKKLDLSYCNLSDDMIPHDFGNLTLLESLVLCGNNFSCLPSSICSLPKLDGLLLIECQMLQFVPDLPSSLRVLMADNCLSLESINLVNSKKGSYFQFEGCPKLKVVEGYCSLEPLGVEMVEKLLGARGLFTPESIASVRMRMFNRLTWTSSISPLQALYEGGISSIFLPLNEIPSWFSYQSEGNEITFHAPALEQGCKILGFIFYAVYVSILPLSNNESDYIFIHFDNKKFGFIYLPTVIFGNEVQHDVMWVSHWAFENMNELMDPFRKDRWRLQDVIEEGDLVTLSINMGSAYKIKRCGINLLYGHNDESSQSNDLATISNASQNHIKKRTFYDDDDDDDDDILNSTSPIWVWSVLRGGIISGQWLFNLDKRLKTGLKMN